MNKASHTMNAINTPCKIHNKMLYKYQDTIYITKMQSRNALYKYTNYRSFLLLLLGSPGYVGRPGMDGVTGFKGSKGAPGITGVPGIKVTIFMTFTQKDC